MMNRHLATSQTSREPIRIRKVSVSSSRFPESRSQSKSLMPDPVFPCGKVPVLKKKPNLISTTRKKSHSPESEDSVILSLNNMLKPMTGTSHKPGPIKPNSNRANQANNRDSVLTKRKHLY